MGNPLVLSYFTISISEAQLTEVLKEAVRQANPDYDINDVEYKIGYAGDQRDQHPVISAVNVVLIKKRVSD